MLCTMVGRQIIFFRSESSTEIVETPLKNGVVPDATSNEQPI